VVLYYSRGAPKNDIFCVIGEGSGLKGSSVRTWV